WFAEDARSTISILCASEGAEAPAVGLGSTSRRDSQHSNNVGYEVFAPVRNIRQDHLDRFGSRSCQLWWRKPLGQHFGLRGRQQLAQEPSTAVGLHASRSPVCMPHV